VIPAAKRYAKDYVTYNAGQPPQNIQLFIEAFNFQTQPNQTLDTQGARRIYRTDRGINGVWKGLRPAKEALAEVRPEVEAIIAQLMSSKWIAPAEKLPGEPAHVPCLGPRA
jgi:hypothetical protein